jgi:hypothetical protein
MGRLSPCPLSVGANHILKFPEELRKRQGLLLSTPKLAHRKELLLERFRHGVTSFVRV